jgi:hypothetical protein
MFISVLPTVPGWPAKEPVALYKLHADVNTKGGRRTFSRQKRVSGYPTNEIDRWGLPRINWPAQNAYLLCHCVDMA